jgi:hypothetical protein
MMVVLALTLGQYSLASAQADGDDPANAATAEDAEDVQEKGELTAGESSPTDAGRSQEAGPHRLFVPYIAGSGGEVGAAATNALVLFDDLCAFPNGWTRQDYLGTGDAWAPAIVGGFCVARPTRYINRMAVIMERPVDLRFGNINGAFLRFRFRMRTETAFDFLRYEFSCNGRRTWRGSTHSDSGSFPNFTTRTINISECDGFQTVWIRFWFQTDLSVIGAERPSIDFVEVTD